MKQEKVLIHTEYIKLDSLLKLVGVCDTGGEAKFFIQDENVKVNDEICTMRGKKLRSGDMISIKEENICFVVTDK